MTEEFCLRGGPLNGQTRIADFASQFFYYKDPEEPTKTHVYCRAGEHAFLYTGIRRDSK